MSSPPSRWVQGETVRWESKPDGYPPEDGWSLSVAFRSAGMSEAVRVAGVQEGSAFSFTLLAADSLLIPTGVVAWQVLAERAGEKRVLWTGRSRVAPDIETAPAGFDPRTPAERFLEALEEIGPRIMANGYASMNVDGVTAEFRSLDEYRRALAEARAVVSGAGRRRKILVRFPPR